MNHTFYFLTMLVLLSVRRATLYVAILLSILPTRLRAQVPYADTVQMVDAVLVTAARIPMHTYKTGRSVEVIQASQLAGMPVSTLDDLLRFVVGVNINARGGFGVQTDIGIRGSTFSQVLVLVDNVRLNDPLTGHFNHQLPVALADIEQVEIIRGPAGVAYGADAVGGLIHVKTKAYMARGRASYTELVGEVGGGQHGLFTSDVAALLARRRFVVSASQKTNAADGERYDNPNFALGNSPNSTYRNFFKLNTYSAALSWMPTDQLKVYVRGSLDNRAFGAKYFYTRSPFDESTEQIDTRWLQGAIHYGSGRHRIELDAGHKATRDSFLFNPAFAANVHDMAQDFAHLAYSYTTNRNLRLSAGAQYVGRAIESTDRGNHSNRALGGYTLLSWEMGGHWYFNTGLRLEHDTNFGYELLPQASVSRRWGGFLLRASYGRAIRAADFTERFVSAQLPNLAPGRNIGNPDLAAERSDAFDVGFELPMLRKWSLQGTFFYRRSDNLIDFSLRNANTITNVDNLLPNAEYFYPDNLVEAKTKGVEFALGRRWKPREGIYFNFNMGYTWLQTDAPAGLLSKYIANHPRHNIVAHIDLKIKWLAAAFQSGYVIRDGESFDLIGGTVPKEYFVSHLRLSATFWRQTAAFLHVTNLTNADYQEILGARPPQRWLRAGIQTRLHSPRIQHP